MSSKFKIEFATLMEDWLLQNKDKACNQIMSRINNNGDKSDVRYVIKKSKGSLCFKNQIVLKEIWFRFIFKPSVSDSNFSAAQTICNIFYLVKITTFLKFSRWQMKWQNFHSTCTNCTKNPHFLAQESTSSVNHFALQQLHLV